MALDVAVTEYRAGDRGEVGRPDLRFRQFPLQNLTDQALIRDAALGGFGFERGHQGFGQAHVDAGGFGGGFVGQGGGIGRGRGWGRPRPRMPA